MKAEELMIGDWVYNKHHRKNIRLTQYDFFTHTHNDFGEQELAPFPKPTTGRDLEPIPLTPEILEKNGWKWNEYNTMMDLVIGTIHIGWGFYKDCLSISDHSDEGNCQISSLRCESVHKLQHTLKLCGIDKEIEL